MQYNKYSRKTQNKMPDLETVKTEGNRQRARKLRAFLRLKTAEINFTFNWLMKHNLLNGKKPDHGRSNTVPKIRFKRMVMLFAKVALYEGQLHFATNVKLKNASATYAIYGKFSLKNPEKLSQFRWVRKPKKNEKICLVYKRAYYSHFRNLIVRFSVINTLPRSRIKF